MHQPSCRLQSWRAASVQLFLKKIYSDHTYKMHVGQKIHIDCAPSRIFVQPERSRSHPSLSVFIGSLLTLESNFKCISGQLPISIRRPISQCGLKLHPPCEKCHSRWFSCVVPWWFPNNSRTICSMNSSTMPLYIPWMFFCNSCSETACAYTGTFTGSSAYV